MRYPELDRVTSLERGGTAIRPPSGVAVLCRPCHRAKAQQAGDASRAESALDRRFTR